MDEHHVRRARDPEQEVRGHHSRVSRLPDEAQSARASVAGRLARRLREVPRDAARAGREARHARRPFPRSRVERGTDRALRRGGSVPVRQRARRFLRSDHRELLQAGPRARLCGNRGAGHHGWRRRALRDEGPLRRGAPDGRGAGQPRRGRGRRRVAGRRARAPSPQGFRRHAASLRRSDPRYASAPRARGAIRLLGCVRSGRTPGGVAPVQACGVSSAPHGGRRTSDVRRPTTDVRKSGTLESRPDVFRASDLGSRTSDVKIHQWVPAAHRGDAIGDSARTVRGMLRAMGHDSELFAMTIDDDLRGDVLPSTDAAATQGDVTIFHFALPSPMTEAFANLKGARVLQYHNITPAAFFAPYDAGLFRLAALGRRELGTLAKRVDLALGDSDFNRQELDALGFTRTGVMPIAVNTARITDAPSRPALERILRDGLINILFVGRIVPNKKIEDHIRLAEMYKRYIDNYYRFIFVGRYDGLPGYYSQIRALITEYEMLPDRFWFTGPVPDEDLAAFYRWSDAYVSLSEHEGFCVPLVESMAADVPVVAYAAGAVPETLGGAGLLFAPKDLEVAAELLGTVVYDREVRAGVLDGQRRRLQDFAPARIEQKLTEVLQTWL